MCLCKDSYFNDIFNQILQKLVLVVLLFINKADDELLHQLI